MSSSPLKSPKQVMGSTNLTRRQMTMQKLLRLAGKTKDRTYECKLMERKR